MRIIPAVLLPALVVAAGGPTRGADDVPCTQNGFYYAVCPEQPHVAQRLVDGSSLPQPLPSSPTDARVVNGSKLSPLLPQRVHGVTASKATSQDQAPSVPSPRKNWRNYTVADWMSISSIFLLALPVCIVFYLVNRTIQAERRKATPVANP